MISSGGPSLGPASAPVTIAEFSDFQCQYCKKVNDTLKQVVQSYGSKVRVVYKHMPLPNHPQALRSAQAAYCAAGQDRFWQYHDLLFEHPNKLHRDGLLDPQRRLLPQPLQLGSQARHPALRLGRQQLQALVRREARTLVWIGAVAMSSGEGTGQPVAHRVDWNGNRRVNSILHIASVTQQRDLPQARAFIDRKIAEGKTRREALRALKRQPANGIWRHLIADADMLRALATRMRTTATLLGDRPQDDTNARASAVQARADALRADALAAVEHGRIMTEHAALLVEVARRDGSTVSPADAEQWGAEATRIIHAGESALGVAGSLDVIADRLRSMLRP